MMDFTCGKAAQLTPTTETPTIGDKHGILYEIDNFASGITYSQGYCPGIWERIEKGRWDHSLRSEGGIVEQGDGEEKEFRCRRERRSGFGCRR